MKDIEKNVDEVKEPEKVVEETKVEEPKKNEELEKVEVKEPEKVVEETKKVEKTEEATVDIEALKNELAEANKKAEELKGLSVEIEALKKDAEAKESTIKEYEELIGKMVETKMEQVPAEFKELIPDNLDLKQKLSWLEKAEAKGLFTKEEKKKPNVEIGKPMNIETPVADTSKMSAGQLLRMAYSSIKK